MSIGFKNELKFDFMKLSGWSLGFEVFESWSSLRNYKMLWTFS